MLANKFYILTVYFLIFSFNGYCQNTTIPDPLFEQELINLGLDTAPINGFVPTANIVGVTYLDVNNKNISNLTGIEDFTALAYLNCDKNILTSLNITKNINLTQLFCRYNQLTALDVSQNVLLDVLWCERNRLTSLDVTKNTNLISLVCAENPINVLDITKNTRLSVVLCTNNQLSSLDITNNTMLTRLYCDYNFITTLDTSKNTEIKFLNCSDNLIPALDITKNTKLTFLFCPRNQLSTLDLSKNIDLIYLFIGENKLTELDVTKNTKLVELLLARNFISELDVSKNLLLEYLSVSVNQLKNLDVSINSNLIRFDIAYNLLCYLNVNNGNNANFTSFSSTNNPNLSCIFVDNIAYSTANWIRVDATSNFVTTQAECNAINNNIPQVDVLNNVVGSSYTLPTLTNGNYYTAPNGGGLLLNAGDKITTSQTIFIYNENICYNNESSFSVTISKGDYYIPKFFTPNNDGIHDFWKVEDFTNTISNITIFNRYGKLLKELQANSEGWNGTFNGRFLETDDYWYLITLNTGETLKGHFTLKR